MPVSRIFRKGIARIKARLAKRRLNLIGRGIRRNVRKQGFGSNFDLIIYPYKQYCDGASLTQSAVTSSNAANNTYAWQFQLNMIPQSATFAALYDVYRIDMIEFTIRPRTITTLQLGSSQGTVGSNNSHAYIVAIDHDDAGVPTNYNSLREYGNAKEFECTLGKVKKIIFKPAVAMNVYNGISNSHMERFSPWIDMAEVNVPHYGIKMALPTTSVNNEITMDITVRYLVSFKQVR